MPNIKAALRLARALFGPTPAIEFGPNRLRLVRDAMVNGDPAATPPRRPWSRGVVNGRVHRLCAMFKWAASHEKLPASVYQQLKTVSALRLGRTSAPEPEPVRPVALQHVEGVRPFLSRPVNALIRLQLLTGARADELNQLLAPPVNEGLCDPDLVPAPPDEATSQPGDLWVLGNHRLLVGDSARPEDVDRLLDGAVIHLANTDPPYNVRVEPRSNNAIAAGNSSFPAPGGGGGGG